MSADLAPILAALIRRHLSTSPTCVRELTVNPADRVRWSTDAETGRVDVWIVPPAPLDDDADPIATESSQATRDLDAVCAPGNAPHRVDRPHVPTFPGDRL